MATIKKRANFFTSEEGVVALQELEALADNKAYFTEASYSANTSLYPDNAISFVDKHMLYLQSHPGINTQQYISNLRLMTRLRPSRTAN